jgi:hypothetical protein
VFTTSLWGPLNDLTAVLEFVARGELRWEVETLPLDDVNAALNRVRRCEISGRWSSSLDALAEGARLASVSLFRASPNLLPRSIDVTPLSERSAPPPV